MEKTITLTPETIWAITRDMNALMAKYGVKLSDIKPTVKRTVTRNTATRNAGKRNIAAKAAAAKATIQ